MKAKSGKRATKEPAEVSSGGFWTFVMIGGALAFAGNIVYQVWRKPTELVGAFDARFFKTPSATWKAFGSAFESKATATLAPEFLAALAQAETEGNPIARTYWKWRWTSDVARIYAPASSAAGLFQMTDSTFREANRFCLVGGEARRVEDGACENSSLYSRLIPSHAIEMTSARLHWHVQRILRGARRARANLRDRWRLATVIHLCGTGRGESFARARFNLSSLGRCGDHDAAAYVRRVERLTEKFKALRRRASAPFQARRMPRSDGAFFGYGQSKAVPATDDPIALVDSMRT